MSTQFLKNRRHFLHAGLAAAGGIALGACGGGSADAMTAAAATTEGPPPGSGGPRETTSGDAAASGPGTYVVQVSVPKPEVFAPGTTTAIASNAVGLTVQVSPDLPPGRTLSVSADGNISVISEANSPVVTIDRPWIIEVMASPIATIINVTKGITYPYGGSWAGRTGNQPANRWNAVMYEASANDVIEVSPGLIQADSSDLANYWSNNLNSALLAIWKPVTLRSISGRGRWGLYKGDDARLSGRNGICIYAPAALDPAGRGSFVVEGFAFDNWGHTPDANGVRIMADASAKGSWSNVHRSVTLSNFKIGKPRYERSASGINGAAETLLIEDGHIYDTGAALYAPDGNDHNAYVSARTLTIRGVRFQRSRGMTADAAPDTDMDGHMLKASAVNAYIDGCCFDADPQWGDNTHHIQAKAGGNFFIRGCLFVDSVRNQSQGRGPINMCREMAADGVTPNFEWWAGLEGNSMVVEKNVFVGHYGRAAVYFFPAGHPYNAGLTLTGVTVRDNIAMITPTPTVIAGFPGTNSEKYILNDPLSNADWLARGNSVEAYASNEAPFANRQLKVYNRAGGPVAATGGSVATRRFQFPHGSVARVDSTKGLG